MFRNAQGLQPPVAPIENAITATAGGTKAAARVLTAAMNFISVCATAADSVLLPPALQGHCLFVRNDGAAACQVFGAGTDTINGVATGTGVSVPAGKAAIMVAGLDGKWSMHLSA